MSPLKFCESAWRGEIGIGQGKTAMRLAPWKKREAFETLQKRRMRPGLIHMAAAHWNLFNSLFFIRL
jgi:hypothetical protein